MNLSSPEKPKVPVKQTNEELITKFQNLQPYLSKFKQIYIEDKEVSGFLTKFIGGLSPEIKEMLPYGRD